MDSLSLAPLPTSRADLVGTPQVGFVDDAVVARLLSPAVASRRTSSPDDLALAADDLDFAGWQLALADGMTSAFRGTEEITEIPPLSFRRATPPALSSPGVVAAHGTLHRWCLAGLAGVLATLILTLLLLLSSRPDPAPESCPSVGSPAESR